MTTICKGSLVKLLRAAFQSRLPVRWHDTRDVKVCVTVNRAGKPLPLMSSMGFPRTH
jgi:hypothetical protein